MTRYPDSEIDVDARGDPCLTHAGISVDLAGHTAVCSLNSLQDMCSTACIGYAVMLSV